MQPKLTFNEPFYVREILLGHCKDKPWSQDLAAGQGLPLEDVDFWETITLALRESLATKVLHDR